MVWLKSLYLIFFYLSFSLLYIKREMIFIQPFCYNFWNNTLSHTLIMLLLSLSITLVFVSRHTFLSIFLVVPYISCTKSSCSNNIPHIKNTNFSFIYQFYLLMFCLAYTVIKQLYQQLVVQCKLKINTKS